MEEVIARFYPGREGVRQRTVLDEALEVPWIRSLQEQLRAHHPQTAQHCLSTAVIAMALGDYTKLDSSILVPSALLHDCGKLDIPARILDRKMPMTKKKRMVIRRHPLNGYNRLAPHNEQVALVVLGHHRHQHTKYPSGVSLPKEYSHLESYRRLLALADQTDAFMSNRPDMGARSAEETLRIFEKTGFFPKDWAEVAVAAREKLPQ